MSEKPENANEECVGPASEQAGKSSSCDGCPNQSACASGETKKALEVDNTVTANMKRVKHRILVLSGKGGVGKSTFSSQLAIGLANRGLKVGLLDVDVCGPSIPTMMGLRGREVHQSASGWSPVYVDVEGGGELGVMSIGFLMPDQDAAVIWRGPRKSGLLTQFFGSVDWGELDYLVVDTPPGTSDEHISIVQMLKGTLNTEGDGALVITTPQEVAMADVRKELNFCKQTGIRVLGVVENMAPLRIDLSEVGFFLRKNPSSEKEENVSDKVKQVLQAAGLFDQLMLGVDIFPSSGLGPEGMARQFNVPFLGRVPLDRELQHACDEGNKSVLKPTSQAKVMLDRIVEQVMHMTHPGLLEEIRVGNLQQESQVGFGNNSGVVSVSKGLVM